MKTDRELLELAEDNGLIIDFWHERVISGLRFSQGHRNWIYASDYNDSMEAAIARAAAQMQLNKEQNNGK